MNTKTTLALLVCVAVGAVALVFFQSKPATTPHVDSGPKDLFESKPTDVTKVEMLAGNKRMVFEKADDKWRITSPVQAPADKYQVDNVVNKITGLKVVRSYGAGETGRPGADMTRLAQPNWIVKLTDKAGKTHTVRVGNTATLSTDTYVQIEGQDELRVVKEDLNTSLQSNLDNYRDKQVAQFVTTDANKITLDGALSTTLVKADGKWMIEKPVRARADASAVNTLLSTISGSYVSKFVDDAPRSLMRYGLDKPRLTVTVETEKKTPKPQPPGTTQPATQPEYDIEHKTIAIEFGVVTDGQVFARLAGKETPWVFQLPENTMTQATPDLNKLRDKQVVVADTLRASKIHVDGPSGSVDLERKDGVWHITSPATFAGMSDQGRAEFAAVDDLLKAVRDLKATEYEMGGSVAPDFGFGPNATHIEITTEGSLESAKLTIGGPTPAGTGVYVSNDRENTVAVVKAEAVPVLRVSPMAFVSRRLLTLPREQVTQLEIASDGVSRTLIQGGGIWRMKAPVDAAPEMSAVTSLVADLSSLDARTIAGTKDDLAKFGLDHPAVTCRVTVQAPPRPKPTTQPSASGPAASQASSQPEMIVEPPVTHTIIAARHDGKAYVFVEGGAKIGEVDDKVFRDLTAEMHSHGVVTLDVSKLSGVELKYSGRDMNFQKKGEDWTLEREPGFKPDATKVRQVAEALRDLKTEKFVDYSAMDMAKYKLDAPAISVTVRVEGAPTQELRISSEGPPNDDQKRRYATVGAVNKIFLLTPADVAKFDKQIKDFENTPPPATPTMSPPGGMPPGIDD